MIRINVTYLSGALRTARCRTIVARKVHTAIVPTDRMEYFRYRNTSVEKHVRFWDQEVFGTFSLKPNQTTSRKSL